MATYRKFRKDIYKQNDLVLDENESLIHILSKKTGHVIITVGKKEFGDLNVNTFDSSDCTAEAKVDAFTLALDLAATPLSDRGSDLIFIEDILSCGGCPLENNLCVGWDYFKTKEEVELACQTWLDEGVIAFKIVEKGC